jgi:ABC-type tungstate transport system permease subunit
MGATLTMADEKQAYVLCDRGTYLASKDKLDIVLLYENPTELKNTYHAIAVNPARHPHVHHEAALAFIDWLTSAEGQAIIGSFRLRGTKSAPSADEVRKGGEVLFHPCAGEQDELEAPAEPLVRRSPSEGRRRRE